MRFNLPSLFLISFTQTHTSSTLISEAAGFNGIHAVKRARSTSNSIAQSVSTFQAGSRLERSLTIRMHSTHEGMLAAVTANHFECLNSAKACRHFSLGNGSGTIMVLSSLSAFCKAGGCEILE